jgi:hypothetical protein
MCVLALQSKAEPPQADLGLTLRMLEIFVTLYLSAEMALEVMTLMTAQKRKQWFSSPWTYIDIGVLAVSWLYLVEPENKIVEVARVARVLRPIRTLRLFHSVEVRSYKRNYKHLHRFIIIRDATDDVLADRLSWTASPTVSSRKH